MFIRTCKRKQLLMITCMSTHTTNAKYTKYMHLEKILPGHKCEVLKTFYQYLKVERECYTSIEKVTNNILNKH